MQFVLVLLVLLAVVLVVSGPLRRGRVENLDVDAAREELEAERDAKYREIRDAELDRRTGKLSDEDWRAVDRALRAEAVAILRRLDELPDPESPAQPARREPEPQAEPARAPDAAEHARPRDAAEEVRPRDAA